MMDILVPCYFIYGMYYAGKNIELAKEQDDPGQVIFVMFLITLFWPVGIGISKAVHENKKPESEEE